MDTQHERFVSGACARGIHKKKAEQILKIGVIQPMTGPGASWGIGAVNGQQIAVDEINESGGITVKGVKYNWSLLLKMIKQHPVA
jgi:ABC-type branched-subunit amino acid transport system substrate-binding protein